MESKEITAMGASAEEDTIDLMEIFEHCASGGIG